MVMPKLGLTMTEATILEWRRGEGERVEAGEILLIIETEKVTLEIEAPASGVLHILIPEGETVPVLEPIAVLASGEPVLATAPHPPAATLQAGGAPGVHESQGAALASRSTHHLRSAAQRASPKARALARDLGIALNALTGTGPRDMIVVADVQRAAADKPEIRATPIARRLAAQNDVDLAAITGTGPGGRIMRQDIERAREGMPGEPALGVGAPVSIKPMSSLRAVIAERLSSSWQERPHVTLTTEADATNLVSARQQAIAELERKVSYDAFLVALVARALTEYPFVNVRFTQAGIEELPQVNVGVAVDTERGLMVPVIRNAPDKSLIEIQQSLQVLVGRALDSRSLPDDLTGGTFTITNLGMFEIDGFTPIINPPESAILGVGRILAKPVAVGREVVVRDTVTLSLSFDHRLIDGAPAARFLQRVKQLVERPFTLALL